MLLFVAMNLISRNNLFLVARVPSLRFFHTTPPICSKQVNYSEEDDPNDINVSHRPRIHATLVPGDGVGPELIKSVQTVFKAADVPIEFDTFPLSQLTPLPYVTYEQVTKSIMKTGVCLKGTLSRDPCEKKRTLQHRLRADLDFYGSVVIAKSLKGIECRHSDIDIRVIRESTEGEYSALEHETVAGVVESLKIITRRKSNRIAKFAFDYATKFKRKKVTAIHKANIMKLSDGLFLQSCENVARLYPRIKFEKMIVDNATMQLVSNPGQFDVMVTPNLYGNIINNIVAGLVGGAGLVPGASYSPERVLFEPGAHHTFLEGAGKNVANPVGMLLCSVLLLNHVNLKEKSTLIEDAILKVVADGKVKTKDVGGESSTSDVTQAVVDCLCDCCT